MSAANDTIPALAACETVDRALVEQTVMQLRKLMVHRGLEMAIEVGQLIIDRFFSGDASLVAVRLNDCPTLRSLAAHPELPLSPSKLYRCIGIAKLVEELPEVRWLGLSATHLSLVLPVEAVHQRRLLLEAAEHGWTTDALDAQVRRVKTRGKGGRPRLPQVMKTVNHLAMLAGRDELWEQLAQLDDVQSEVMRERIRVIRERLGELEGQLAAATADM